MLLLPLVSLLALFLLAVVGFSVGCYAGFFFLFSFRRFAAATS
jgi:hypothetical protein